ncbi:inactive TPR repeat-containing thioredoxin TTL3-like protein, partial [Tanacetum coccineum]
HRKRSANESLDESDEEESESLDFDYDSVIERAIAKKYGRSKKRCVKRSTSDTDDDHIGRKRRKEKRRRKEEEESSYEDRERQSQRRKSMKEKRRRRSHRHSDDQTVLSMSDENKNAFKKFQEMDTQLSREERNCGTSADANRLHAFRALSTRMDPEKLKIMGNGVYKSRKFAEALSFYDAAIFLDPESASYRSNTKKK